ncbi:MAG: ketol-acid reductoisomerase [Candidatus Omnitrophica bacterium]|nr:Ketol-acid reductoisomerase (NAD(+)) [bacterium]NUN95765.1 ketol-acid reductoisomerase [Candidatus Omnitrophota bacterium]
MKTISIGNIEEQVVDRADWPIEKVRETLKDETIAIIGYGVQGPAQALNLRDNGIKVIVGQSEDFPRDWNRAVEDGWEPGKTLFSISEAAKRGTIVQYLLSDAGQKACWDQIKPHMTAGKALYFSHGFSIVFKDQTGVIPPPDIDVIMVAPKGSGTTVRRHFLEGRGINSSYAVHQDASGKALDRTLALGFGIGSGYLFETTFEKEVWSDLTGERGVLMGAIYGLWLAQYDVLRAHGHSPSEAFNETVEEATQSLYPLIGENGMDWMYANCSATAQRGALDWFRRFYDSSKPVFEELYDAVKSGREAKRVIEANSRPDYQDQLKKELTEIHDSEMWRAGAVVRSLRPERVH